MNDYKRIKSLVKISDVMNGEGYSVEQIGKTQFVTQCINPEHHDKNPSLQINEAGKYAKCFPCGLWADVFNILEIVHPHLKGKRLLNYVESKYISGSGEETISSLNGQEKVTNYQDDKDFRAIMNFIALYWFEKLPNEVRDTYLISTNTIAYNGFKGELVNMQGYGLDEEIIKEYLIGYSPNSSELYKLLLESYDKELIEKTQLFDKRGMPRFKNRLVIPYFKDGEVVYFTARQTEFTPMNKYDKYKYINQSIDNKYLYNEDDLENICIFICEGPFDCLAIKNIGYKHQELNWCNAIALGGIQEIEKLPSYFKELQNCYLVYICFDNDGGKQGAGNIQAQKLDEVLRKKNIASHPILLPLLGRNKVDICEYLSQQTKEDLCGLLSF